MTLTAGPRAVPSGCSQAIPPMVVVVVVVVVVVGLKRLHGNKETVSEPSRASALTHFPTEGGVLGALPLALRAHVQGQWECWAVLLVRQAVGTRHHGCIS